MPDLIPLVHYGRQHIHHEEPIHVRPFDLIDVEFRLQEGVVQPQQRQDTQQQWRQGNIQENYDYPANPDLARSQ